jgi:hypothetical protein
MSNHPIIPPPNLTDKWNNLPLSTEEIFVIAAQWGADQELEASVAWLDKYGIGWTGLEKFRNARRPEPPRSLKEQALEAWEIANQTWTTISDKEVAIIIRRALESLPND